jgi:hypothetical protein
MRSGLSFVVIAVIGLFGATSIGYAAYVVSKDSVGLPVTKLKTPADRLAPKPAQAQTTRPKSQPTRTVRTTPVPPPPTTTVEPGDDHGGRGRDNSGKGGGSSGGGGGGGDD